MLHEIYTGGEQPYSGMSTIEVATSTAAGHRMGKHPLVPSTVYNIMLNCWEQNKEERPSFDELVPIFKDFSDKKDGVSQT